MTDAKPIVVIYLPDNFVIGNGRSDAPMELMRALNGNFGEKELNSRIQYSDYWQQYYWFCFTKYDILEPEFKVFYPKDFTEIQYEELKKMVEDGINSLKNNPQHSSI